MTKKYELVLDDTIKLNGDILYRIRALKNLPGVNIGDLGGFIQSEDNLSHEDDCWVFDNAKVCNNARICHDAIIRDYAYIRDDVWVGGLAFVGGHARLFDRVRVFYNANILYAFVFGDAKIGPDVRIGSDVSIGGQAVIKSNDDVCWFGGITENGVPISMYRCGDNSIIVTEDVRTETIDEFLVRHNNDDQYRLIVEVGLLKLNKNKKEKDGSVADFRED